MENGNLSLAKMSGRVHDQSHFYKHTKRATAKKVIETRSFRWSAPTKFNDPFDHQFGFVIRSTPPIFAEMLAASLERQIFSDSISSAIIFPQLPDLDRHVKAIRDQLPRDNFTQLLRQVCLEMANELPTRLAEFNSMIQAHLCHSRVLCVSEVLANVVMWSHYAEQHQGVAFKLRCDNELDNILLAARQVRYTDQFISFPDEDVFARHLTGEVRIDLASLIWQIVYTKHVDWSYEKEWRVHRPLLDEPAGDGFTNFVELPSIFEAVYLGCRMPQEDADEISCLIRQHLPRTKIYRAVPSAEQFTLKFIEIDS